MKSNITKQVIRAMRDCTYLGFRLADGKAMLEAVLNPEDQPGDNPFKFPIVFRCEVESHVIDYGTAVTPRRRNYKAFASVTNYDGQATEVGLLAGILKDGDCLAAEWVADNSNQTMQDAGLTEDALNLVLYRRRAGAVEGSNAEFQLLGKFQFESRTTHTGSSVRLVQWTEQAEAVA